MPHSKKETPAQSCTASGEVLGSNNGSVVASGNVNSRVGGNLKAPAIVPPIAQPYIQITMSAATSSCYGAHIPSPANRVGQNTKNRLRRKQGFNCGVLKNKTPAAGASQAGAECVVDTGINQFDSQIFCSTSARTDTEISSQKETPAAVRGKLGAEGWTVGDFAEVPEALLSTSQHLGVARAYVVNRNLLEAQYFS
jgi:hypothetical protein